MVFQIYVISFDQKLLLVDIDSLFWLFDENWLQKIIAHTYHNFNFVAIFLGQKLWVTKFLAFCKYVEILEKILETKCYLWCGTQ